MTKKIHYKLLLYFKKLFLDSVHAGDELSMAATFSSLLSTELHVRTFKESHVLLKAANKAFVGQGISLVFTY